MPSRLTNMLVLPQNDGPLPGPADNLFCQRETDLHVQHSDNRQCLPMTADAFIVPSHIHLVQATFCFTLNYARTECEKARAYQGARMFQMIRRPLTSLLT
jgi:hypothetical protein